MCADVLIVDDHPLIRISLRYLLDREEDMAVTSEAAAPEDALRLAEREGPDLAVVDLRMDGEASGADLCRDMKKLGDPPRVLVYTAFNSHHDVYSCFLAGADGFVHKGEEPDRLVDAARDVLAGKKVWLLGREPEDLPSSAATGDGEHLTEREQEVLALVLEGHWNRDVAEILCVSLATVKTHVGHIFRKLGISRREDLFRPR